MNILQDYRYLSKPLLIGVTLYFMGSNMFRYLMYLLMLVHLMTESYHACGFKYYPDSLTYIAHFWIMFGLLLGFDLLNLLVFGYIPMPMLTNFLRFIYIAFLIYDPANVQLLFRYIEPYLIKLSDMYSVFLLYALAILK